MKTKKSPSPSLVFASLLLAATAATASAAQDEFKAIDTDNDGKVTREQHLAFSQSLFKKSDANHDQRVSLYEWNTAATAAGNHEMNAAETEAQLRLMDTDGDGQVSAAESDKFAADIFAKSDKNSDGILTAKEYKAAEKKMKKELKEAKKR